MGAVFSNTVAEESPSHDDILEEDEADVLSKEPMLIVKKLALKDIRPDNYVAQALISSVEDMQTLKTIFDGWAMKLDRSAPKKMSALERQLFTEVDQLRDAADTALRSSKSIIKRHYEFADVVARLLDDASTHPTGDVLRPTEAMRLGDEILEHSAALAEHVSTICNRLDDLVRTLEGVKQKRENANLWQKIWGWLKKAFRALAAALVVAAAVAPVVPGFGVILAAAFAGSAALSTAAATLCRHLENDDEGAGFDKVIVFLRQRVPEAVKHAQSQFEDFKTCHRILQIDVEMSQSRCVRMERYDAQQARDSWRAHRNSLQVIAQ